MIQHFVYLCFCLLLLYLLFFKSWHYFATVDGYVYHYLGLFLGK